MLLATFVSVAFVTRSFPRQAPSENAAQQFETAGFTLMTRSDVSRYLDLAEKSRSNLGWRQASNKVLTSARLPFLPCLSPPRWFRMQRTSVRFAELNNPTLYDSPRCR
jgi:hypothetical protein